MTKIEQIAADILAAVGGKENVASVTHCMTRLRFNLKDEGLVNDATLKTIPSVISVVHAGGQVQVVIGQTVDKVYDQVCKQGNFEKHETINENLEVKQKEKLTFKRVINGILDTLSGTITPILPIFIIAGIFKMLFVLIGPSNLNILHKDSNLLILFDLVGNAGYYYLPIFIAYSASKKFGCNPIYALIYSTIMIHPSMLAIVTKGEAFDVYGIPMKLVDYTQGVLPVILIVWVMSYVEKWLKKVIPDMLRTIGIPIITMLIMLPLGLCVFGPLTNYAMGFVQAFIIWLSNTIGIFALVVVAALWTWIKITGMHVPLLTVLLPAQVAMGYDTIVYPAMIAVTFANMAVCLAYALRSDSKENKSLGMTAFVTMTTANVGEPFIYGILLRDKKAIVWHTLASMAGALVLGILGAKVYIFSGVGFPFLNPLRFGQDLTKGIIGCAVTAIVGFVLAMMFGFEKKKES